MPSNRALKDLLGIAPADNAGLVSIVCSQTSSRLKASLKFIFEVGLQCHFEIVSDVSSAKSKAILVYGQTNSKTYLTIPNSGFLFEKGVRNFEPEVRQQGDIAVLFSTANSDFDLFSAVFFLISRYEEWLPFTADEHGRFEAEQSFLYKHNLLQLPVIDAWLQKFKLQIKSYYPEFRFVDRSFRSISTIDIDNLYAYKGKGFKRTVGAALRDILNLNEKGFIERIKVLLNRKKDPFDIYDEISDFCFQYKIPLFCFFLMRTGTKFDRSVEPQSVLFKDVISRLKNNMAFIGLHPSYYSYNTPHLLDEEIKYLQLAGLNEVNLSRQHYLRGKQTQTAKILAEKGIQFDFSMGFASKSGFRAGTSLPFYYYDFDAEKESNLVIVPFCAMDGVWTEYGSKSTETAEKELSGLIRELKKVNGLFVTVYHERSFSDHLYKGFGTLYKKLYSVLIKTQ